jgi:formylglycine-generating enzyme required for sulfatase activity
MGAQACEDREVHYDPKSYSWESPPHEVHLGAFFLSKYEMTQAQWQRVARANPSTYTEMGERTPEREGLLPVETVSWTEATRVLTRLGLELPTEAQWEYAARAGTDTRTWCGDSELTLRDAWAANVFDLRAWYEYEDQRTIDPSHVDWLDDGFALHAPVGSFAANAFGFHDVLGNVWEWCEDLLTPYVEEPRRGDGLRSVPAPGRERVLRGGCFRNTGSNLSSSNRENLTEDVRLPYLGVRPARAVR